MVVPLRSIEPLLVSASSPLGLSQPVQIAIVVSVVALVGVLFILQVRGRGRRRASIGSLATADRIEVVKARNAAEDEISAHMAEVLELTQRLAAQLDAKAARLEHLLYEAESAIAAMNSSARSTPAPDRPAIVPATLPEPQDDTSATNRLAAEVARLADQGFSPLQIAQRLEESTGKIELILALRRQKPRAVPA